MYRLISFSVKTKPIKQLNIKLEYFVNRALFLRHIGNKIAICCYDKSLQIRLIMQVVALKFQPTQPKSEVAIFWGWETHLQNLL